MGTDEISLGNFRVRTQFSNSELNTEIKVKTAELIDLLNKFIHNESKNPTHVENIDISDQPKMFKEKLRLVEEAQLRYEDACMWAVKAVTLK